MKELSIEEKAKAYDKVREKIALRFGSNVAEEIFSEYEESEDERIRKALINGFNKLDKSAVWYNGITNGQILAWLERQGKNSMGISEATKQKLEDSLNKALEKETSESCNEFLNEQKSSWSEEVREEPAIEDLGDYINELSKQFPEVSFAKLSRIAVRVANWQKEQMMAKAIDCEVHQTNVAGIKLDSVEICSDGIMLDNTLYKEGDKVKVNVIKED